MARETVKANLRVEGLKETLRAIKQLDKEASAAARDNAQRISEVMATYIRQAGAQRTDKRDQYLAQTVKAGRDRLPVVRVGGRATPKVSGGGSPQNLVIGMEFGARRPGPNAWRFPPRTPKRGRGNEGYWIYPTARAKQGEIINLWFNAMDRIIDDWSE